ncbi:hypothetical protein EAG_04520 [Camponotus floridanus]|uniref:Uncharacterized protein n=1 Tax=Camponotus floridanus TaxID=104421 RepID=E2AAH3_CAMFO|nr:hypothetical protein EAG_04520 [Camponotus floridanus]
MTHKTFKSNQDCDGKSKYGEDGGSKSRREQWDNERDEEKVADVKCKQPRCDLTRTRPGPCVQGAPSALRIAPWKRTMAGICKSVITAVFVRRI